MKDNALVSAAMADACSMVHLVCLFMKTHLLALLQDNCLDLVRCVFLRKLSAWVRNTIEFCQYLLRPIILAILDGTEISVKPKYQPDILARPIYWSISNYNAWLYANFTKCKLSTFLIHFTTKIFWNGVL